MATIHKRIPFINGGEFLANENDSPIRMITGQNSQIKQADYWFGEDGVMWVRFRTRSTVNDAWSHIYRADSYDGGIIFWSDAATSTSLTIMVKGY